MTNDIAGTIADSVYNAGVIGAGGGGFPTHIKLKASVDTLIANGSECEPLLASDKTLLKENPERVIDGMKYVMSAIGAKKGFIAIKSHYKDVVAAVKRILPKDNSITIHLLENYYPAGDEFLTVYDVTKRVIPEGGLPLHVGVVVSNVLSLAQVAHAVNGKPVTERPITIAGSVKKPVVVTAPIGTLYKDLIKLAGGKQNKDDVVLDGGPMMGAVVDDLEKGVAKTTSGIVVLPKDHIISRAKLLTISQMVKRSKAACCQCFRCTDFCPRNLLGHALFPHQTMRTIDYNLSQPIEHITSAFLCSQCGVCELLACDFMFLSPRQVYAEYRKLLIAKGIKNPHTKSPKEALSSLEFRKIPIPTLLKKLDLSQYAVEIPSKGFISFDLVRIPIKKHTGAPALPTIAQGQTVQMGDIIAASPTDKIGTVYHASIPGKVTFVSDEFIEIRKQGFSE